MNLKRCPQQESTSLVKSGDILFGSPGPQANSAPLAAGRVFNKNRKQSDPNETRNHLGLLGRGEAKTCRLLIKKMWHYQK